MKKYYSLTQYFKNFVISSKAPMDIARNFRKVFMNQILLYVQNDRKSNPWSVSSQTTIVGRDLIVGRDFAVGRDLQSRPQNYRFAIGNPWSSPWSVSSQTIKSMLFSVCIFLSFNALSQTPVFKDLKEVDKRQIKDLARKRIENGLDQIYNQLIAEDTDEFFFRTILANSTNPNGNQVFYQDNVRIINDYNPVKFGQSDEVKTYFNDFIFLKKNTPNSKFEFEVERVGDPTQGSYLYLELDYRLKFDGYYENRISKGKNVDIQKVQYKEQHLRAELRADKIGTKWEVFITRISNNSAYKPSMVLVQPTTKPTETKKEMPVVAEKKPAVTKPVAVEPKAPEPIKTESQVAQNKPKYEPKKDFKQVKSSSGSVVPKILVAVAGLGAGAYGYSLNSGFSTAKSELESISSGISGNTIPASQVSNYNAAYDKAAAAQGKKGLFTAMLGVVGVAALVEGYLLLKPKNNTSSNFKIEPSSTGIGLGIRYKF